MITVEQMESLLKKKKKKRGKEHNQSPGPFVCVTMFHSL
jgi:hypothetical protein